MPTYECWLLLGPPQESAWESALSACLPVTEAAGQETAVLQLALVANNRGIEKLLS